MHLRLAMPLALPGRRVRSFLRREYPLLFFLPPLVVGQLTGYEFRVLLEQGRWAWCGCVAVFVFAVALRRVSVAAPFLLGVVGMAISISGRAQAGASPDSFFATLLHDPRHRQTGAVEGEFSLRRYPSGQYFGEAVCRAIYLPWRNISTVQNGDTILVQASVAPIALPLNPAAYDAVQRRHGITASCRIVTASRAIQSGRPFFSRMREAVFARLTRHFGSGERTGLFLSMVLGFRDLICGETFYLFQASGLAHLLVVSGYHVTLIFTTLLSGFRQLFRRLCGGQPQVLAIVLALSCAGALFFVGFIGVDGASLRAAIAVCVVVASRLLERGSGMVHSIMLAFLVLILLWPGCFLEPGIQLTFAALIGIAWGLGCRSPRGWVRYLAVCVAPSVTTLGVSIIWFGSASFAGFVLNPLVAPFASMVFTVGGLVALMLLLSGIDSAGVLMQVVLWLMDLFKSLVFWSGGQDWAVVEFADGWSLLSGTAITMVVIWLISKRIYLYLIEMGVVIVE